MATSTSTAIANRWFGERREKSYPNVGLALLREVRSSDSNSRDLRTSDSPPSPQPARQGVAGEEEGASFLASVGNPIPHPSISRVVKDPQGRNGLSLISS